MGVAIPQDQAIVQMDLANRGNGGCSNDTSSRLGIDMVSQPVNAEVDICFIHGLTGDRSNTWTNKDNVFWPQLLARTIPKARIMTYGYDADVINFFDTTNGNGLRGYGQQFLMELTAERESSPTRRLMFIAHSLGGLVVEEALLGSLEANKPRFRHLAVNTIGVVYLGTPHRGSDLATWMTVIARVLGRFRNVNETVLKSLRPQSEVLYIMEERFQSALHGRLSHVEICCYYEAKPSSGNTYIVEEQSATFPGYTKCSIDADHVNMAKFSGVGDPGFKNVADQLTAWIRAEEISSDEEGMPAVAETRHSNQWQSAGTEESISAAAEARRWETGHGVGTGSTFNIGTVGHSAVVGNQSARRDINNARTQIGTRDIARNQEDRNSPRRSHQVRRESES